MLFVDEALERFKFEAFGFCERKRTREWPSQENKAEKPKTPRVPARLYLRAGFVVTGRAYVGKLFAFFKSILRLQRRDRHTQNHQIKQSEQFWV